MFILFNRKPDMSPNTKQCVTAERSPQGQNPHLLAEGQASSQQEKEKRHSFTGLPKPHHTATNHNR